MIENILEIRKESKQRKPEFIRQDTHKRRKLSIKWKKPQGIHSKIRHHFKGRSKMPSPGYKSPRKVKNLHSSGLKIINIASFDNLKGIKKENEGIVVAKNVGMKKRLEIFKKAKELNVQVLNLNVDQEIKKIEDSINSKKKKIPTDTKKEETREKEHEQKKQAEKMPELSDEQKKEFEKKEKDRVLTKKS